jgi:coproporphyrinogen III oxidase-like Fe-S oxidoreductase
VTLTQSKRLSSDALQRHRFLLKPGRKYQEGVKAFEPYDSIKEENPDAQAAGRTLIALGFLRSQTGVHIHADLIVRLPGEDLESFAAGFDRLIALGPGPTFRPTKRATPHPNVRPDSFNNIANDTFL